MSNTIIRIKNGRMAGLNSLYVEENKIPTIQHFEANGWTGYRNEDGSLIFVSARTYSGNIVHSKKCTIFPDGMMKVTYKVGNDCPKTIFRQKLANSVEDVNGELILSGGNVEERYVRFRNEMYIAFLIRWGIDKVVHVDPNGRYYLGNSADEDHYGLSSDGVYEDSIDRDYYDEKTSIVSEATWAMYTVKNPYNKNRYHRELRTMLPLEEVDRLLTERIEKGRGL